MGSVTHDWPGHVDSVSLYLCTLYFTNEEFCISGRSPFLGDFSRPSTVEKHSSKIPCQGVESHPVQAWNPSHNFWRWSLSVSEWFTVVWIGTCYLFIQIFRHCILSQCTLCLVNYSETTTMLDAWLFTGGTPYYLPPHERPPNDLCLYQGWETQFEWHRWNCNQLKSSCQRVSVAWVSRAMSFVLQQKDCSKFPKQNWKLRWTFFWLQCSDCLELAAGRPESLSLSPPAFKANLKTYLFRQAFCLICTC